MPGPYILGLTGNIATGKTTVGKMLLQLGATQVIDLDQVSHDVIEPGRPAFQQVVDRFGQDLVTPEGRIDRAALGRIVFGDKEQLRALEAIIHPAVGADLMERIQAASADAVLVVDAVKLIETGLNHLCAATWMVTSTPDVQLWRLQRLRGHSLDEARARIAAQEPVEPRLAQCSAVISNDGSLEATLQQVQDQFRAFLASVKRPAR